MSKTVKIEELAGEVMKGLTEYSKLATTDMKKAVRKAGNEVRSEIQANAPKDTGAYAKSWAVKKMKESSEKLEVVVHSKNRYQLAHLLEYGHALRGGGRAKAQPHIAPAEEHGIEELEKAIERALKG